MTDFAVTGARVRGFDGLQDIVVSKKTISEISPARKNSTTALKCIDAEGGWVYPSFVNCHTHLDKALMTWAANDKSQYVGGKEIGSMAVVKQGLTPANVVERGSKVIEAALSTGTTFIRTHVDIDPIVQLKGMEGVLRLKERYADYLQIQIAAFAQEGFEYDPKMKDLMRESVRMGAEVVGGKPTSDADWKKHIDILFDIAKEFNCEVDVHVDTNIEKDYQKDVSVHADGRRYPNELEGVYLAEKTIDLGMQGHVIASHLCALDCLEPALRDNVIELLAKAEIGVITMPSVCLYIVARGDTHKVRRGCAPARELLKGGVCTAYATDNLGDAFNLYSNPNMLVNGWLASMMYRMKTVDDIQTVMDMGTLKPAKLMKLKNYGLRPGCDASFMVFQGTDFYDVFVNNRAPKLVFHSGRLTVTNTSESRIVH